MVCTKRVDPLQGFTNYVHGRWVTKHAKCMSKDTRLDRALAPRVNEVNDTVKYVNPQLELRF